jgi:DNA-binding HxlR family transcriptional regulator
VLTDRLAELRTAGIIDRGDAGYGLTAEGKDLLPIMLAMDKWATRWAARSGG